MNTEAVKQEITNILSEVKQPSRKQYPVAKHQIATLTELGLIELMPAGFGHTDARVVIEAATNSGNKANVGWSDYGDASVSYSNASKLYQLLNEKEAPAPEPANPEPAKIELYIQAEEGIEVEATGSYVWWKPAGSRMFIRRATQDEIENWTLAQLRGQEPENLYARLPQSVSRAYANASELDRFYVGTAFSLIALRETSEQQAKDPNAAFFNTPRDTFIIAEIAFFGRTGAKLYELEADGLSEKN
jgi:hypothetical protein